MALRTENTALIVIDMTNGWCSSEDTWQNLVLTQQCVVTLWTNADH